MFRKALGQTRAVVVGINEYPDPAHNLPSCVEDATYVAELLRSTFGFEQVETLLDADATIDAVTRALGNALDGLTSDDRVVFYFSGHGTQTIRVDELRESLCLYDRLLNDDVLVQATQQIPAGVFTVVLDSCFSGGMSKDLVAAKVKSRAVIQAKSLPRRYRAFGAGARRNYGPIVASNLKLVANKLIDETGPTLNGLLVSACLENETAAASTSHTEGLSAFTYGLRRTLDELGALTTAEAAMTRLTQVLREINIVQSPQLHPPEAPAMNELPLFLGSVSKADAAPAGLWRSRPDPLETIVRATLEATLHESLH